MLRNIDYRARRREEQRTRSAPLMVEVPSGRAVAFAAVGIASLILIFAIALYLYWDHNRRISIRAQTYSATL